MGLKGDPSKLKTFAAKLRALPVTLAAEVATDAAPAMTELAQGAYDGGRTVYGEARPAGVDGKPLDLEVTGATKATLQFVSIGTIIRCRLGTRWAKFLIGKYRILPNGGMPTVWRARLDTIVHSKKGPGL